MEKYSKLGSSTKEKIGDDGKVAYGGIEILKLGDDVFVKETDTIVVLPYLVDEGYILLRSEQIPTFQYGYKGNTQYKNTTKFITAISGKVETGENPVNSVRRELYESVGIVLSNSFAVDVSKPLFASKSNCTKIYTCMLEIRYNDYRQTTPKNVITNSDKESNIIKVDLGYLDDFVVHDLVTEMLLDKLRLSLPKNKTNYETLKIIRRF